MNLFDIALNIGKSLFNNATKNSSSSDINESDADSDLNTYTRSFDEWENYWQYLGPLNNLKLSHLSSSVGLYRAKKKGQIVYLGRAVEYNNGGLRKRLSDYTRASGSSRKHKSGQLMNKNATDLEIEILITGGSAKAADLARKLEVHFVSKYQPEWNKMLK
ncbi:MAG: hypothetical protein ACOYL3_10375 [Desulfuromonadaceae bacterium]